MLTREVDCTIARRLLVNYRVDPEVVAAQLPAPFRPQTVSGWAVGGVCFIALRHLRRRPPCRCVRPPARQRLPGHLVVGWVSLSRPPRPGELRSQRLRHRPSHRGGQSGQLGPSPGYGANGTGHDRGAVQLRRPGDQLFPDGAARVLTHPGPRVLRRRPPAQRTLGCRARLRQ
jgi:hypothetical protein